MKFDANMMIALLGLVGVLGAALGKYFSERKKADSSVDAQTVNTVGVISTAALNALISTLQATKSEVESLKTEISKERALRLDEVDSERAKRRHIEDDLQCIKKRLEQKELAMETLEHNMKMKRVEWEDTLTRTQTENIHLKEENSKLNKQVTDLQKRVRQLESEVSSLIGDRNEQNTVSS